MKRYRLEKKYPLDAKLRLKSPGVQRGQRLGSCGGPVPRGAGSGGRPSRQRLLLEVPGGLRLPGGLRRAARAVPRAGLGPAPPGSPGSPRPKRGVGHRVGEAALARRRRLGRCAGRRDQLLALPRWRPALRAGRSVRWVPRPRRAPRAPAAHRAESATASPRAPRPRGDPAPPAQRLLPTRAALPARLVGSGLARHGLPRGLRLRPGPRIQLRLRLCAQLRSPLVRYIAPRKVRAASARPAPPAAAAAAARRPRGRRGHGPGRREGGRGSEALAGTSGEGRRAVLRAGGPGLPRGAGGGRRGSPPGSEAGERAPGLRPRAEGGPGLGALLLAGLSFPPGTPGAQPDLALDGVWSEFPQVLPAAGQAGGFKIRPFPFSAQPAGGSCSCILAGSGRSPRFGSPGGLKTHPRNFCVCWGAQLLGRGKARPLPCLQGSPSPPLLLWGWADEPREDPRRGAQTLLRPLAQSLACAPSSGGPARPCLREDRVHVAPLALPGRWAGLMGAGFHPVVPMAPQPLTEAGRENQLAPGLLLCKPPA